MVDLLPTNSIQDQTSVITHDPILGGLVEAWEKKAKEVDVVPVNKS